MKKNNGTRPQDILILLQIVAKALARLEKDIVFVGGSVAELYADYPEISDIRPTIDIDCIIEINSRLEYSKLDETLSKNRF